MQFSRRTFILTSLSAAVAAAGATAGRRLRARPPEETYFEWKSPRDGVRVAFGAGGNALVLSAPGAAMLVDCKNAPFGPALRREALVPAGGKGFTLTAVVNTHHHGDHSGGNHAFTKDLPVIAQEKAKPRIEGQINRYISQVKESILQISTDERPVVETLKADIKAMHDRMSDLKPAEFAPTLTFAETHELDIGGHGVHLRHFGAGHTDNDIIVHIPDLNVIHAGDLLFNKLHPVLDPNGGSTTVGWQSVLDKVIALCDDKTLVIPGHGELTDIAGLRAQHEYFTKLRRIVEYAKNNDGMKREEVVKLTTGAFEGYGGESRLARALGFVYDEIDAKAPGR